MLLVWGCGGVFRVRMCSGIPGFGDVAWTLRRGVRVPTFLVDVPSYETTFTSDSEGFSESGPGDVLSER